MSRPKKPQKPTREERLQARMTNNLSGRRKGECEPIHTGDMTAALTLATDSIRKRGGIPYSYLPTQQGLDRFIDESQNYFNYVNEINSNPELEKKLIPDVESYCIYLGICRATLFEYEKRGGEWSNVIRFFKDVIGSTKKQLAMSGKIPPVLFIFDATNNHNYVNASEFKVQSTATVVNSEQTQLERDLVDNGLVWDEEAHDFRPIEGEIIDVDGRTEA